MLARSPIKYRVEVKQTQFFGFIGNIGDWAPPRLRDRKIRELPAVEVEYERSFFTKAEGSLKTLSAIAKCQLIP